MKACLHGILWILLLTLNSMGVGLIIMPTEGELLQADKARNLYEDIVRQSLDPALLEFSERDVFKVRIFPIEAHARRHITVGLYWIRPGQWPARN